MPRISRTFRGTTPRCCAGWSRSTASGSSASSSGSGPGRRPAHAKHHTLLLTSREVSMSRYCIPSQRPGLTVIVGWDNPLRTLFAQVFNPWIEEDADACLLWIGTAPEAIPTLAALQAQLVGWATIPDDIVDHLLRDQQTAT